MNRYNGPSSVDFGVPASGTGVTHFIKATSDVGFRTMLSNPAIAEALINELFKSIHLAPIRITDEGRLEMPLQEHGSFTGVDHHAITTKREHIIIEMQMIRHDNFDKRVLFHAASTFAHQKFEDGEWALQIKDVYTIQFVDYFTQGSGPIKYYEAINRLSLKAGQDGQLLPYETLPGIRLIQVELNGEGIRDIKFPVQRELTELEWWWYIIKYSNQFDPDEVERCKKLGLSERMEQALRQLEYVGLDPKKREAYAKEITEIDTYDDELRRMKLRGLLAGFIDFQKISSTIVQEIQNWGKLFPRSLVEGIGNRYIGEGKISKEQLGHFVKLLAENGVLSD